MAGSLCSTKTSWLGSSLATYGEYSEGEVAVFNKVLKPGDVAIDVGANIGALTIPMARLVGENGCVYAFEASAANFDLLRTERRDRTSLSTAIDAVPARGQRQGRHAQGRQAVGAARLQPHGHQRRRVRSRLHHHRQPGPAALQADQDRRRRPRAAGAQRRGRDHRALQPVIYIENEIDAEARGAGRVARSTTATAASGTGRTCSTSTTCAATRRTSSARWSRS